MSNDRSDPPKGVPDWLGSVCGGIAGGALGWRAGTHVAHAISPHPDASGGTIADSSTMPAPEVDSLFSGDTTPYLDLALSAGIGALGVCAGYSLGSKEPNNGLINLLKIGGGIYAIKTVADYIQHLDSHVSTLNDQMQAMHDQVSTLASHVTITPSDASNQSAPEDMGDVGLQLHQWTV